jgi:hypothetical protein
LIPGFILCFNFCSNNQELEKPAINNLPKIIKKIKPNGIYYGAFLGEGLPSFKEVIDFEEKSGESLDIVTFFYSFGDGFTFPAGECQVLYERGIAPLIKWEPWSAGGPSDNSFSMTRINKGEYDKGIENFAIGVANWGKPVFIAFGHEMNGGMYPWGLDPDNYVKAYRRIVNIFNSAGAMNVTWIWNVNIDKDDITKYYPGDEYVNWIGVDGYSTNWSGNTDDPEILFGNTIKIIKDNYNQPVLISETAYDEYNGGSKAGKAKYIEKLPIYCKSAGLSGFVYFNFDKPDLGFTRKWSLDERPEILKNALRNIDDDLKKRPLLYTIDVDKPDKPIISYLDTIRDFTYKKVWRSYKDTLYEELFHDIPHLVEFGTVYKREFVNIVSSDQLDALWEELNNKEYICCGGLIKNNFNRLRSESDMKLSVRFIDKRSQIYDILRVAQQWSVSILDFQMFAAQAEKYWNLVSSEGYIDKNGRLQAKFTGKRQDFSLKGKAETSDEDKIFTILKKPINKMLISIEKRYKDERSRIGQLESRMWAKFRDPKLSSLIELAELYMQIGDYEKSKNTLMKIINSKPITNTRPLHYDEAVFMLALLKKINPQGRNYLEPLKEALKVLDSNYKRLEDMEYGYKSNYNLQLLKFYNTLYETYIDRGNYEFLSMNNGTQYSCYDLFINATENYNSYNKSWLIYRFDDILFNGALKEKGYLPRYRDNFIAVRAMVEYLRYLKIKFLATKDIKYYNEANYYFNKILKFVREIKNFPGWMKAIWGKQADPVNFLLFEAQSFKEKEDLEKIKFQTLKIKPAKEDLYNRLKYIARSYQIILELKKVLGDNFYSGAKWEERLAYFEISTRYTDLLLEIGDYNNFGKAYELLNELIFIQKITNDKLTYYLYYHAKNSLINYFF